MAKISSIKANRSECRKRGPISRDISPSNQTPSRRRTTLTPYNCLDYRGLVLAPDNIRIIEIDYITKLNREDQSGQNIFELYDGVKEKIIDQRKEVSTPTIPPTIFALPYFI